MFVTEARQMKVQEEEDKKKLQKNSVPFNVPKDDFMEDSNKKNIDYIEHAIFKPIFANSCLINEGTLRSNVVRPRDDWFNDEEMEPLIDTLTLPKKLSKLHKTRQKSQGKGPQKAFSALSYSLAKLGNQNMVEAHQVPKRYHFMYNVVFD